MPSEIPILPPVPGYRTYAYANPWNLTTHQYEAIKELCMGSTGRECAELLGVAFSTFYARVRGARELMGTKDEPVSLERACYLLGMFEAGARVDHLICKQSQKPAPTL